MRNRLGDFDRLHLSDGKIGKRCLGIEIHTYFFEPVGSVLIHLLVINDLQRTIIVGRESAQVHILSYTSGEYGLKLLMHHGNTHFHGFIRIVDGHFLAINIDFAGVHLVNAEKAFHKC